MREDVADVASPTVVAFLTVSDFRHGVRSMEALVQMCKVASDENWLHVGSLPAFDQMHMHVDAREFLRLVDEAG